MASSTTTLRRPLRSGSAAPAACAHCGLPVPAGRRRTVGQDAFCCGGCEAVHGALHDLGLERYYELAAEAAGAPARTTGRSYAEYDDPTFQRLHCREVDGSPGLRTVELYLEGVHCAACLWVVERLPAVTPGLLSARLDLGRCTARLIWSPDAVQLSDLSRKLDALGYPVHPARGLDLRRMRRLEDRRFAVRLGVAGAIAGNVMLIAFALYGGLFSAMDPGHRALFRWSSLLLASVAVLWPGALFFRGALGALRTRALHMDLPIAIGVAAGFAYSAINTVRGAGEVYFDSVTVLVFLLLAGRWLLRRQQRLAFDATAQLFDLAPTSARRWDQGAVRDVPVESLLPGQIVEVLAGDSLPVDGVVTDGRSRIDAALLTGESRAVAVRRGDRVLAGTVNAGARLLVRVEAAGEQTRVGRLMQRIEELAGRRAPIVQLADRVAGVFVAVVLVLAAAALGLWLWLDPSRALDSAVALLIVTCPCALGLATPLAVSVAVGRAARSGILIKGGDVLELLAVEQGGAGAIWLDKTGTLTEGRTRLVRRRGSVEAFSRAVALEKHSAHHLARALIEALPGIELLVAEEVQEQFGAGVAGRVAGERVLVGSPGYMRCAGVASAPWVAAWLAEAASEGLTPVLVARSGVVEAAAAFGDPLRDDAREALQALRRGGWELGILSGDHVGAVSAAAGALELPAGRWRAGLSPEEKLKWIQAEASADRTVVMVGDGVNDAAALAAASVGVAVHGGAEASLAAADVYIDRPGLSHVARLVTGARQTLSVIRRNLVFSLAYNVVGAGLALAGLISPLVAAVLMPLSSLTVLISSYRVRTFSDSRRDAALGAPLPAPGEGAPWR